MTYNVATMKKTATLSREAEIERYKALKKTQKLSRVFAMPELANPSELLTKAEIDFFLQNGFLIKKGRLPADETGVAVKRIWQHLVKAIPTKTGARMTLDDPESWLNPQWETQPPHPQSGPFQGRQPIEHYGRIVKLHDLGNADYLLDLFANNKSVRAIAQRMLGASLKPSVHTRGVYLLFPTKSADDPDGERRITGSALGPHSDQVCQQLNACAYLEDVSARNGGFTVYPGSHKIMFGAHQFESNWSPLPTYYDAIEEIVASIEPLELTAAKGSVIFWHGRLLHSVGIHTGASLRWALFGDFTQDRETLNEDEHRALDQYEWFKDAHLFRHDHEVTSDMWRNWVIG